MAMEVRGGASGVRSDINITPLVDVVLVLLIIFMVAVPLLQMGYPVQVPPKVETAAPPPQSDDQVIVRMDGQGNMFINKTMYPENDFGAKLRDAMTGRAQQQGAPPPGGRRSKSGLFSPAPLPIPPRPGWRGGILFRRKAFDAAARSRGEPDRSPHRRGPHHPGPLLPVSPHPPGEEG